MMEVASEKPMMRQSPSQSRSPLFGQLDHDAFTIFAGTNRHLYENVVLAIYRGFFQSDIAFPTETEVVGLIYGCFAAHPELWIEDEVPVDLDRLVTRGGRRLRRRRVVGADDGATGAAITRSRHVYNRLCETGWLEESKYGLKVTVDMPAGAMRLAEFLCSMRDGASEQLGGLIVEVRNAVEGARAFPAEKALGLNKAARDAAAFGRYLRSVLSALRDIDNHVVKADSLGERLRYYFEDFVERVLLRDYSAIATTAHPYRFRGRILRDVDLLEDSETDLERIAEAYRDARLAADLAAARHLVSEDLSRIRGVFDRIEEAFDRIQQHRAKLETRLRNVVRYSGRRSGFLQRSETLILKLDLLHAGRRDVDVVIHGPLEPRRMVLAPTLLARPRGARAAIVGGELLLRGPDPMRDLRRRLEREYLDRIAVSPAQVARFLERRIPPFGETSADRLWIETLDDFLAFEALRLTVGGARERHTDAPVRLGDAFEISGRSHGPVDNDWLACPGFLIRRLNDSVTLDDRLGGDHRHAG